MKKNKLTFLIAEILLAAIAIFFASRIFFSEKPQKRVAVIIDNSGDEKWNAFVNGLKQAADTYNIHLIICNTDEIENGTEEKNLINEQLDNDIDAFIIQAAPGYDVHQMLTELADQKPVILVANDALTENIVENIHAASTLTKVMPDNYKMGYELGEEILKDNGASLNGKTLGIVGGLLETDCTMKRQQGLKDALADSGCVISWEINAGYDNNVMDILKWKAEVDYLAVLDNEALVQLCEREQSIANNDTLVYGIGTSIKSVYYLDEGRMECLVMADAYGMGYDSVDEIAKVIKGSVYKPDDHVIDTVVLRKEDIFTEETQKFLYTYE